jgi:hypothetical protein
MTSSQQTMFEHIGGHEGLHRLVADWYRTEAFPVTDGPQVSGDTPTVAR